MTEVSRREKQEEIIPDPDVDIYMKVTSALLVFFLFMLRKF